MSKKVLKTDVYVHPVLADGSSLETELIVKGTLQSDLPEEYLQWIGAHCWAEDETVDDPPVDETAASLKKHSLAELREIAEQNSVEGFAGMNKTALVEAIKNVIDA